MSCIVVKSSMTLQLLFCVWFSVCFFFSFSYLSVSHLVGVFLGMRSQSAAGLTNSWNVIGTEWNLSQVRTTSLVLWHPGVSVIIFQHPLQILSSVFSRISWRSKAALPEESGPNPPAESSTCWKSESRTVSLSSGRHHLFRSCKHTFFFFDGFYIICVSLCCIQFVFVPCKTVSVITTIIMESVVKSDIYRVLKKL